MGVEIGLVPEDRLDVALAVDHQAFNDDTTLDDWRRVVDLDRLFGAWSDGLLGGLTQVIGLGQWLGGRRVPTGAVTDVAVLPELRGRGIAPDLMRTALRDMHERGEALSVLHPATTRLYRNLGYELATHYQRRSTIPRALAALGPVTGLTVGRVTADDGLARIRRCYEEVAPRIDGFLDRPDPWWHRIRVAPGADRFVYAAHDEASGAVRGYVSYRHVATPEEEIFGLRVGEIVAADRDALVALWRLLGSNASMVDRITWPSAADDPLVFLLPEQPWDLVDAYACLGRLIDVDGAIAARGYTAGVTTTVGLAVHDTELAHNSGTYTLRVEDGEGALEPGGTPALELGIGALTSLYTGFASARRLADAGLVQVHDDAAPAELDAAFGGAAPWFPDDF